MSSRTSASRRSVLTAALAGPAAAAVGPDLVRAAAHAGAPSILKALPADRFVDFGTNAEMRWDSVDHDRSTTPQARLFVRDHTRTPRIDAATWRLAVHGTRSPSADGQAPGQTPWRGLRSGSEAWGSTGSGCTSGRPSREDCSGGESSAVGAPTSASLG